MVELLREQLGNTVNRLYEYRRRCGCLSMAGVCPWCAKTMQVEHGAHAALELSHPAADEQGGRGG